MNLLCLVAIAIQAAPLFAQDISPETTRNGARALILEAARANGLSVADVRPWHLKFSFQFSDNMGTVYDQGTYEEFWVSAARFKQTLTDTKSTKTLYGTKEGSLILGDSDSGLSLGDMEAIRQIFVNPIQVNNLMVQSDFEVRKDEETGSEDTCIAVTQPLSDSASKRQLKTYCFDANDILLRVVYSDPADWLAYYSNPVSFQGSSVPSDLHLHHPRNNMGHDFYSAHLVSIEPLTEVDESEFKPPPNAVPLSHAGLPQGFVGAATATAVPPSVSEKVLPQKVNISGGVAAGLLVKKTDPIYPQEAADARVSGTVVLQAFISTQGYVESLHIVSGPAMLQQAALDAVKDWVYRPYLLNNVPVEVQTTVNVVFRPTQ